MHMVLDLRQGGIGERGGTGNISTAICQSRGSGAASKSGTESWDVPQEKRFQAGIVELLVSLGLYSVFNGKLKSKCEFKTANKTLAPFFRHFSKLLCQEKVGATILIPLLGN